MDSDADPWDESVVDEGHTLSPYLAEEPLSSPPQSAVAQCVTTSMPVSDTLTSWTQPTPQATWSATTAPVSELFEMWSSQAKEEPSQTHTQRYKLKAYEPAHAWTIIIF
jgi:hypothetical protein